MKSALHFLLITLVPFAFAHADEDKIAKPAGDSDSLSKLCTEELKKLPGPKNEKDVAAACQHVRKLDGCESVQNKPIFHYDKLAKDDKGQRILVFSLIHGDEGPAGAVTRYWMERLENLEPRNFWRVIPILNPDGLQLKTRTNANGIDLNRNFPTKDWDEQAVKVWKQQLHSNPRRNPGTQAGSEIEVQCALKHIEDFKPHFIVSIHTPLKVLDFDGPKIKPPKYDYLPWKSLGHYAGSLGRYMWFERNTPVLTTELYDRLPSTYSPFEKLQDVIGQLVAHELDLPNKPARKSASTLSP